MLLLSLAAQFWMLRGGKKWPKVLCRLGKQYANCAISPALLEQLHFFTRNSVPTRHRLFNPWKPLSSFLALWWTALGTTGGWQDVEPHGAPPHVSGLLKHHSVLRVTCGSTCQNFLLFWAIIVLLVLFVRESCYVVQAGLELRTLLSPLPWNYSFNFFFF